MTLNITMVNKAGVWQCSDFRTANRLSGRLVSDRSMKQVGIKCPDGFVALTYTGLGAVAGVDISDWLRMILRGVNRSVDQALIFVRESATRDLGPRISGRLHHTFNVGAFVHGHPWLVQIRNYDLQPYGGGWKIIAGEMAGRHSIRSLGPPMGVFKTIGQEVKSGGRYSITGTFGTVEPRDARLLRRLANSGPENAKQVHSLLADINRRASQTRDGKISISPHCATTYVTPSGEFRVEVHNNMGADPILNMPLVAFGIDYSELGRGFDENGTVAAVTAVTPRNPLRRS